MLKYLTILGIIITTQKGVLGQNFKVLHYTETSGFDHNTRQNSLAMFQALGNQYGFTVDDDQTGAAFDTLTDLQEYAVVIFSNTSGDQILDSLQRANFEAYITAGGSFLGIHAASDTYRHSTANGNNTGSWDFYAEMLGGSVQENPNHTGANHIDTIDIIGVHASTGSLPDPWIKQEEYYYWENGYYNPINQEVLQVRTTGPNSYDAPRPVSWYKEMFTGSRLFYTALGHDNSNYISDTLFIAHIRDALLWAADFGISLDEETFIKSVQLYPNPVNDHLILTSSEWTKASFRLFDSSGRIVIEGELNLTENQSEISVKNLPPGKYFMEFYPVDSNQKETFPVIIE